MNGYNDGANGTLHAVQFMALQELHRAWRRVFGRQTGRTTAQDLVEEAAPHRTAEAAYCKPSLPVRAGCRQ